MLLPFENGVPKLETRYFTTTKKIVVAVHNIKNVVACAGLSHVDSSDWGNFMSRSSSGQGRVEGGKGALPAKDSLQAPPDWADPGPAVKNRTADEPSGVRRRSYAPKRGKRARKSGWACGESAGEASATPFPALGPLQSPCNLTAHMMERLVRVCDQEKRWRPTGERDFWEILVVNPKSGLWLVRHLPPTIQRLSTLAPPNNLE